jgi:type III pantothenate kinase
MNIIAVDIGNTNITLALYLKNEEKLIEQLPGTETEKLTSLLKSTWQKIPTLKSSKEKKRDGVIVLSYVKPAWTKIVKQIVKENLDEKIYLIPKDIPYPIDLSLDKSCEIGSDRVISAAAAYAVTEEAVVVADFGTAVTIDLVDDRGVFCGGVIFPGFEISAEALKKNTAQLPKVSVKKPKLPFGKNTDDAINAGLYYSAVSTLQEVIRRYAEKIGTWPKTIITGSAAKIIQDDCEFIDSYVPNLVVKGIALTYQKYIESKTE